MKPTNGSEKKIMVIIISLVIAIVLVGFVCLYALLWAPSSYQAKVEINIIIDSNDTAWICLIPLPVDQSNNSLINPTNFKVIQGNPTLKIEYINNESFLNISSTEKFVNITISTHLENIHSFYMSNGMIDNTFSGQETTNNGTIKIPSYLKVGNSTLVNIYCKLSLDGFLYGSYSEFQFSGYIFQSNNSIYGENHKWSTE